MNFTSQPRGTPPTVWHAPYKATKPNGKCIYGHLWELIPECRALGITEVLNRKTNTMRPLDFKKGRLTR